MKQLRLTWVVVALAAMVFPLGSAARAAGNDEAATSSADLLRAAMTPSRDGLHIKLLRALRQLGDPELKPLFSELFLSSTPSLKIHGLLGLAECSPEKRLDLERLQQIASSKDKDAPALQAEVVSAAMDAEVLTDDQCRQLINWPGLDSAVKVLVSAPLIKKKTLPSIDHLKDATKADNVARKGMALLFLLQMGDATALPRLQEIDKSTDPKRDQIREVILETALRYDMESIGPWALAMSSETGIPVRLNLMALRTALRFNVPGANDLWRQQYDSNADAVSRTRLALVALHVSPWCGAKLFEPLAKSDDPFIKQVGLTGPAVADQKGAGAAVVTLIKLHHPIANSWALGYARKQASDADAQTILAALIKAGDEGTDRNRSQRLDDAQLATQVLFDRLPASTQEVVLPILTNPNTSPLLAQAVLVGLVGGKGPGADKVIASLKPFPEQTTNLLALILTAKSAKKLTPQQLTDLSVAVRGGGALPVTVRIQAGWTYLRLTNQTRSALAAVLSKD